MLLIKLHEMTYKRPKIKDSIDDHVQQIVENWCLVYIAQKHPQYEEYRIHWAKELATQLIPGVNKLGVSGLSDKAQAKLVDEVLLSDAKLDRVPVIARMIELKFSDEGMDESYISEASEAWVRQGLAEIRKVLMRDVSLKDYKYAKTIGTP